MWPQPHVLLAALCSPGCPVAMFLDEKISALGATCQRFQTCITTTRGGDAPAWVQLQHIICKNSIIHNKIRARKIKKARLKSKRKYEHMLLDRKRKWRHQLQTRVVNGRCIKPLKKCKSEKLVPTGGCLPSNPKLHVYFWLRNRQRKWQNQRACRVARKKPKFQSNTVIPAAVAITDTHLQSNLPSQQQEFSPSASARTNLIGRARRCTTIWPVSAHLSDIAYIRGHVNEHNLVIFFQYILERYKIYLR